MDGPAQDPPTQEIMYRVYLERGDGTVPWPRIVLKNKTFGSHEEGRVLQPEHADTLRKMLIKFNVDKSPDSTTMQRGSTMKHGYTSSVNYYDIYNSHPNIEDIKKMYEKARVFVEKLKNQPSGYIDKDGYCYNDDPTKTKIDTKNAADPGAGAAVGEGGSRRRRPSRKYKKSKRVLRRKSRSTRRR